MILKSQTCQLDNTTQYSDTLLTTYQKISTKFCCQQIGTSDNTFKYYLPHFNESIDSFTH